MKKLVFLFFAVSAMLVSTAGNLEIGDKAKHTNVKMVGVDGKSISLDEAKQENGLLIIFSCNTCPFVIKWEDRYNGLKEFADKNNIGMVVLNSNYKKRSGDDSLDAMKKHAKQNSYQFSYLVDKESLIANSFGGKTTPHVFLFDEDFKLAYKGAIDDNYDDAGKVNNHYLKDAMKSVASGQNIKLAETKPVGCSIKRKTN